MCAIFKSLFADEDFVVEHLFQSPENRALIQSFAVGNDAMVFLLKGLGFVPRGKGNHFAAATSVAFGVPSWRWDISAEADLVEEIARLYGLDNIPDTMPAAPSVSALSDAPFRAKEKVRETCLALGFTEAMHYSFLSAGELDAFDPRPGTKEKRLPLPDPVSAEYGVLRDSLLPQMMASLGRNATRQVEEARLFEIGRVFFAGPKEAERLSLGFCGPVGREALNRRGAMTVEETLLKMKGAVETLAKRLHAGKIQFKPVSHPAFRPEATLAIVINGRETGVLGVITDRLRHPYRLTTQMALAEIDLAALVKRTDAVAKPVPVPQFPAVMRDIAFVAGNAVTFETVEKCIRKAAGKDLTDVGVFDIFALKELGKDKRSFGCSLTFRSQERTLKDGEVNEAVNRVIAALKTRFGVEVRGV